MIETCEKPDLTTEVLVSILDELKKLNAALPTTISNAPTNEFVHVPFKGSEIYLLHKAFLDAGGAPHDNFKSLLEKTLSGISNKTQRGFSAESIYKCSDKVSPEAKENVKRFLQRMIRNIDSYY